MRKLSSVLLCAALVSTPALSAAPAAHADLPFDVPALTDPVTGYTSGPKPVQHPGAPVPKPFTTHYVGGFISDISPYTGGVYLDVNKLFFHIKDSLPATRSENLAKAIAVNNAAANDPALIKRAQVDAAADKEGVLFSVADALGSDVGPAFLQALKEHRLPKTQYLLGNGYAARAGGVASSTFVEKYIFNYERPFEVAPTKVKKYPDGIHDFYGTTPSFPSGHTNQAVWITTLLAYMLPELAPQIVFRGMESGHHRVVMGVHYPLDVVGGRMSGYAAAADRLNDPRMREALDAAAREIHAELQWRLGKPLSQAVREQRNYITTQEAVKRSSEFMDYGFAPTYRTDAPMRVPQAAPVLLASKYPNASWGERAEILRRTASAAGHPLDWQADGGSWQRLNLVAALAQ